MIYEELDITVQCPRCHEEAQLCREGEPAISEFWGTQQRHIEWHYYYSSCCGVSVEEDILDEYC